MGRCNGTVFRGDRRLEFRVVIVAGPVSSVRGGHGGGSSAEKILGDTQSP